MFSLLTQRIIRPCQKGYKIGPLFAETAQFAEQLFWTLTAHELG
ncbi:MAG: hypothetical protein AAFR18_22825 [Cyanobacteria bacterium J06627_32]